MALCSRSASAPWSIAARRRRGARARHHPLCAQTASPRAIAIPGWFVESFLDFREDIADARRDGKRVMVYFGQDGCPYCKLLMQTTFTETRIVDKARKRFVSIALNLWGDREVTWVDGRRMTEKDLGRLLQVQFTPTLLFFDENANVIVRLNGYQPPHGMEAALEYVANRLETKQPFADYLQRSVSESASPTLNDEPFFMRSPYDLARSSNRPLLAVFERAPCASCDELHRDGFRRREVAQQLGRMTVARFDPSSHVELIAPDGRRTTASAWARDLRLTSRRRWCSSIAVSRSSASKPMCGRSTWRRRSSMSPPAHTGRSPASSASFRRVPTGCAPAARRSISGSSAGPGTSV